MAHPWRLIAALPSAFFFAASVHAFAPTSISYPGAGTGTVTPTIGGGGQTYTTTGGGVSVVEKIMAKPGVDFTVKQVIPKAGVATALGIAAKGFVGKALPWLTAASIAKDIYCELEKGKGWVCDPMQAAKTEDAYVYHFYGASDVYSSAGEACAAVAQGKASANECGPSGWKVTSCPKPPDGGATYATFETFGAVMQWDSTQGKHVCKPTGVANPSLQLWSELRKNVKTCPPLPDGSSAAPSADGKCPTGTMQPASGFDIENKIADQLAPEGAKIVSEGVAGGVDFSPQAKPDRLEAPAKVTEAPKVSEQTAPDGSKQTKTETTEHAITITSPTTYTWTSTTITNNYDGTKTTTTDKPQDERSECEKSPETLGCAQFDVPDAEEVKKEEQKIEFAPDGGWGPDTASCPAPQTVSVLGRSVVIENKIFCDYFVGIRAAVIACFGFCAAMIFVGGIKQ